METIQRNVHSRAVRTQLLDLYDLSRPQLWWFTVGPVVVGLLWGASSLSELFSPFAIGFALYFLVPANILIYGINDVFDQDTDEYNDRKSVDGPESVVTDERFALLAVLLSVLLGIALVPSMPPTAVAILLLFFVLTIEYSAPPLRIKSIPFFDGFSNCLYFLPGIAAYYSLAGELPPLAIIAVFFLRTAANHAYTTIGDLDSDRRAGILTTGVFLGEGPTLAYSALLWIAGAAAMATISLPYAALLLVDPVLFPIAELRGVAEEKIYLFAPLLNFLVGVPLLVFGALRFV